MGKDKETRNKKKPLKKLEFYDTNFKVFGISLLIAIITTMFFDSLTGGIGIIFMIIAIVPMITINWGMLYHQIRSGSYGWLTLTILLFFIGLAPISLMTFYWIKMRKEFQKGNGIYN